jgi:formyl-CoA transferase
MSKAFEGVRILDFTHVQSGPTCTQLLAWFGADVIKVERAGEGDATRGQLRDIPGVDSLYFTMLNHNKRSITLDTKKPMGKQVLETLIKDCDVLVENFAPGALDRMGFSWERIQELNPRMIVASVKGFGPGPYQNCKVYENVAQCAGGAAATTGFDDGPPVVSGAQIGDSGSGLHLALGIVTALYQRNASGRGQKVDDRHAGCGAEPVPRQAARPAAPGAHRHDGGISAVRQRHLRRFGAARRQRVRRRPAGLDPQVQGLGERSQRLHLFHRPGAGVAGDLPGDRARGWITDPDYATARARLPRLMSIFGHGRGVDRERTKFEVMDILNKYDIPCGPILSMKEIAEEPSLRASGTIVEVDHPERGKYLTVGNPIKLSDSPTEVTRSPLLGEHTEEVLRELGYSAAQIAALREERVI